MSYFCVPGFGAGASLDNDSSRQNGYPQNRHLREAHQTLDNNLGKKTFLFLISFVFVLDPNIQFYTMQSQKQMQGNDIKAFGNVLMTIL